MFWRVVSLVSLPPCEFFHLWVNVAVTVHFRTPQMGAVSLNEVVLCQSPDHVRYKILCQYAIILIKSFARSDQISCPYIIWTTTGSLFPVSPCFFPLSFSLGFNCLIDICFRRFTGSNQCLEMKIFVSVLVYGLPLI